jgi:hypothetical protein
MNDMLINDMSDYWRLPPMLGEICDRWAVILYEQVEKTVLACSMVAGDVDIIDFSPKSIIKTEWFYPHKGEFPTKVVLEFPDNGIYSLFWHNSETCIYRQTICIGDNPSKFIFVSCDMLEAEVKHEDSMWTRMNDEINTSECTCLFHLGDQAYMDNIFVNGLSNIDKREEILYSFGKRYYDTWKGHHAILSHVSNYNIWDDHEIKNNVNLYDDQNLSNDELIMRDIATEAYGIYQESLHLDDKNRVLTPYSWYKVMGKLSDILIIAIERTSAVVNIIDLITNIHKLCKGKMIKRLILCFSSAPIPRPHGKYGKVYKMMAGDDIENKFWNKGDLATLYFNLFNWIDQYGGEVLVVGGDLHFGTHGVVSYKDKEINVIISSPITNQPSPDRWVAAKGMRGRHVLMNNGSHPIIFTTISSKARRCYAVVNMKEPFMMVRMEYSMVKFPKHPINYIKAK